MTASARSAVLILNHFLDGDLVRLHRQLAGDLDGACDVYLLSDRTQPTASLSRLPGSAREFRFRTEDLVELGYPARCEAIARRTGMRNMPLGNADLPVLLFARNHPQYDFYWVIEYDVRFSGSWSVLMAAFEHNDADLLGTTLTRCAETPDWCHWPSLQAPRGAEFSPHHTIRGFFPVYRLSNRAVECHHRGCMDGARGHMEGLLPTQIAAAGLRLEDIGGDGEFVAPGNHNRFYRNVRDSDRLGPGTFVYRPARPSMGADPDTLWHPVKREQRGLQYGMKRLASRALAAARG